MAKTPNQEELQKKLSDEAEATKVPGAAVGIYHAGKEQYAFHGVTSVENPVPVDENTLFQFGSTGKTFTATAIMRLVEAGRVDLHEPVRTYIPELKLKDRDATERVTLLNLLNHTAGWQGDHLVDTGDGDDALAMKVDLMADLEQEFPLAKAASYNNASVALAGRVVEKVTGKTFEQAMKELVLDPVGLKNTYFFTNDIMTRRFVVGHVDHPDGTVTVARPWKLPRGGAPSGGMSSNAADQITWARFHLGDGRGSDGAEVLAEKLLRQMQEPTVDTYGAIGDYIGISWMLRDVDGVRIVEHGGSTIGQESAFLMVPEGDFAIAVLTNASPAGGDLHKGIVRWALESWLGLVERDPEPMERTDADLAAYVGRYETIASVIDVAIDGGGLLLKLALKPEEIARIYDQDTHFEQPRPVRVGILPGPNDRFIAVGGPYGGEKGFFMRTESGAVEGIHFGGRLAVRI